MKKILIVAVAATLAMATAGCVTGKAPIGKAPVTTKY